MLRTLGLVILVVVALASGSPPAVVQPVLPLQPVVRGDWHWPVPPPRSIARPFIAPSTPYAAGHRGIDVRAPGSELYAPAEGIVHFAGVVVNRPVLSIRHGNGVISGFEPVIAAVGAGDAVTRGQLIGTVLSGHCATPCVHVGVRVDGEYVSPLAWFGGIPRSILLPTRWGAVTSSVVPPRSAAHGRISAWDSWMTPRASTSRRSPSGAVGLNGITPRRRGCSSSRGARPRDGPR